MTNTGHIDLNRHFVELGDDQEIDLDLLRYIDARGSTREWADLLDRRRVVILAEAGSGKSSELVRQAELLNDAGKTAFLTTLQKIGQRGSLEGALGKGGWRQFEAWLESGEDGWLLLDSVDEAKKADFILADVLEDVAGAIDGVAGRIHLVLTGRFSDWEFKRDLATLLAKVPLPLPDAPLPKIDADEEFKAAIRNDKKVAQPTLEQPLVTVMAPFDREQAEAFAAAKGVTDTAPLFEQLDKQNLLSFARRPVDLDWIVAYWRKNGWLGSLSDMIEQSLSERLKEINPIHGRKDILDSEGALRAIERVGAGMVLGRLNTVVIPDAQLDLAESSPALNLGDILPDWSSAKLDALITRAVFDPATPGFAKLHNDNQGSVSGYLAARWLQRRRTFGNLSWSRLWDLLFGEPYDGQKLVKPSMRSTAAWLALWDAPVAKELLKRDPRLLMDAGDPASLSLPVRVAALDGLLAAVIEDEHYETPDRDSLQRFAKPDLADYILSRWTAHSAFPGARSCLLLMVGLGEIKACGALALEASLAGYADRYTPIFAGRAIATACNEAERRAYISYALKNLEKLDPTTIWEILENFYPALVDSAQFITFLEGAKDRQQASSLGIEYYGPRLAQGVTSFLVAEELTRTVLDLLTVKFDPYGETDGEVDDRYLETLEVAAGKMLEFSAPTTAPELAIRAALRLGENRGFRSRLRRRRSEKQVDLNTRLNASPQRRRAIVWTACDLFRAAKNKPLVNDWQLQMIGVRLNFSLEDIDWLLADISTRDEHDVPMAINIALTVWRESGEDEALKRRIGAAANSAVARTVFADWFTPKTPNEQMTAMERDHRAHERASAIRQARQDRYWLDFRDELRANPNALLDPTPPSEAGADTRLFQLWRLLGALGDNRSNYTFKDLSPLKPLFGDAVVEAFRKSLIGYWRQVETKLPAEKTAEESGITRSNDLIALAGITQEALAKADWAKALTRENARLATKIATYELNGFPWWLDDLSAAYPTEVGETLWAYARPDLAATDEAHHRMSLQTLGLASDLVVQTIAYQVIDFLQLTAEIPLIVLEPLLRIARRLVGSSPQLLQLASERASLKQPRERRAAWLAAAFGQDPAAAMKLLTGVLTGLSRTEQALLVQATLPKTFDAHFGQGTTRVSDIPFKSLEQLVILALELVDPAADNDHPDEEVYSRGERDYAEDARGALFNTLANTPGYATYAALQRFREIPNFPVWDRRLLGLAKARAEADSESEPWRPQDVFAFESDNDSVPGTSRDLQRVAISRLDEIKHDLQDGDANQGRTVARLPAEVDVQNWFFNELRARQGRAYVIEREPHVADENEPDLRLQAKINDARCPIEIKVAASWSLKKLSEALTIQLQKRYLRDRDNRFGILLVVLNSVRKRGWRDGSAVLSFAEVIEHLVHVADTLATEDSLAPQIAVVGVDVSNAAAAIAAENEADQERKIERRRSGRKPARGAQQNRK